MCSSCTCVHPVALDFFFLPFVMAWSMQAVESKGKLHRFASHGVDKKSTDDEDEPFVAFAFVGCDESTDQQPSPSTGGPFSSGYGGRLYGPNSKQRPREVPAEPSSSSSPSPSPSSFGLSLSTLLPGNSSVDPMGVLGHRSGGGSERAVKSVGRGSPTNSQAEVTERMKVDPNLMKQRSFNEPLGCLAPLGGAEDFVIREMEFVYAVVDRSSALRRSVQGYPDLSVFAVVNGLPVGTHLMFVGQCLNRVGIKGTEIMDVCAVRVCGTCTIENNGWDSWAVGDIIGFSSRPYTIGSVEKKSLRPAVEMAGQPLTKFVPALFVFRETDIHVLHKKIAELHRLTVAYHSMEVNAIAEPEKALSTLYLHLIDASSLYFNEQGYTSMKQPIELYARYHALRIAMQTTTLDVLLGILSGDNFEPVKFVQKTIDNLFRCEAELFDRLSENIGLIDALDGTSSKREFAALEEPRDQKHAIVIWTQLLPSVIDERCSEGLVEQAKFIRAHTVGKCVKAAKKGYPGDLLLGYRNWQ